MEKVMKEWEELKSFLPEGWKEKAKESKAICRTRKVGSAEELLRVELLHFGEGLSLKETSAVAKGGGISDISSVVRTFGDTDAPAGMVGGAQSPCYRWISYKRTGKYGERLGPSL